MCGPLVFENSLNSRACGSLFPKCVKTLPGQGPFRGRAIMALQGRGVDWSQTARALGSSESGRVHCTVGSTGRVSRRFTCYCAKSLRLYWLSAWNRLQRAAATSWATLRPPFASAGPTRTSPAWPQALHTLAISCPGIAESLVMPGRVACAAPSFHLRDQSSTRGSVRNVGGSASGSMHYFAQISSKTTVFASLKMSVRLHTMI